MNRLDLKQVVNELNLRGMSDKEIAKRIGKKISTVRYYINRYSEKPNRRLKYSAKLAESLARARQGSSLKDVSDMAKLPPPTVLRLVKKYYESIKTREDLADRGYFNHLNSGECFAVGIDKAVVISTLAYLRDKHNLFVELRDDAAWLVHRGLPKTQYRLTYDNQVAIFESPKLFLFRNAVLIKAGWELAVDNRKNNGRKKEAS